MEEPVPAPEEQPVPVSEEWAADARDVLEVLYEEATLVGQVVVVSGTYLYERLRWLTGHGPKPGP